MSAARALASALVATAVAATPAASWRAAARRGDAQPAAQGGRRLSGSAELARAYDAILDARFDRVEAQLARACGPPARSDLQRRAGPRGRPAPLHAAEAPAPAEACDVLRATALWWRIQIDPHSLALDAVFEDTVNRAIAATEAWTGRDPENAEAWFYLGGAYGARVQWRVLREERLAAARDGKRIKHGLERALALEPQLTDAYFGLGLYKYYADVAPAVAKVLRWFLLLPGGDREEGLVEMLRAQHAGELLQGEADYQLHIIYLWYEQRADLALALLERLQERYPWNPHFPVEIAEVQDVYFHDVPASLASYRALLAAAQHHRVAMPEMADAQARLGIAKHLETLAETDRAIDQLRSVIEAKPRAPFGAAAEAQLRLGEAYDRLGQRPQAADAFTAAIAAAPPGDPHAVRARATAALNAPPDPRTTSAYRLSLDAWRAFERGDAAAAAAILARALELAPGDFVARSRYGRVLAARGEDAKGLAEIERALAASADAPASLVAIAFLEAGRIHERAGRRDEAAAMYRHASNVFGCGADVRDSAARALARLAAPGS